MRFLAAALRPGPAVPWPAQAGAFASWCGAGAWGLLGLAYLLPHPWSEVGWLSLPPAALATLLGLAALALSPALQKGLGLLAAALGGSLLVVLRPF